MKTKLISFSLLLAVAASSCGGDSSTTTETTTDTTTTAPVAEATPATEPTPPPMDSAAMAKAWMDYMTPGDMHKWMASADGNWSGEVKSYMSPDAPPTVSTATINSKMVMGGRYQQQTFKGNMNGMPFDGISMLAYDNAKKEFVNTWIDNMGTGITVLRGKMDEASKTLTLEGKMTDPGTGQENNTRQVVKFPDANTQTMEMYCDYQGKEMKMMEMTMKKK